MPGPFVNHFLAVVEPLFGRAFTNADGIPEAELDAMLSRIGYELPEVLQDFYAVVGRFEPVLEAHKRFYPPGRFSRMDGNLVFCEENQVVVYSGNEEKQGWRTDPPVYQGVNGAEIAWYVEAERCSEFLTRMIYWQALFGGLPHCRFAMGTEAVLQVGQAWPSVSQEGDSQLFSRGASVFSLTQQGRNVEVQAAAQTEGELDELFRALGLEES
jgi:hypothetical protein